MVKLLLISIVLSLTVAVTNTALTCYRCQYDSGVTGGTYVSYGNGAYSVKNIAACKEPFDHTLDIPTAACDVDQNYCELYNWTFNGREYFIRNCARHCKDGSDTRTQGSTTVKETYQCCQLNHCNGNFSVIATVAPAPTTGSERLELAYAMIVTMIIVSVMVLIT